MTHEPKPRQPLFWAAVALSVGLWVGARAWRPPSWWLIAAAIFGLAVLCLLSKRDWLAKALALGVWFLLGAFLIQNRTQPHNNFPLLALTDGSVVTLTGHVVREGYVRSAGARSIRESMDLETEEIASLGKTWLVHTGVRLTIYERSAPGQSLDGTSVVPSAFPTLKYGNRLRVQAKLHPPRNYRNPGAFDYEGYLRENGISVLGSAEASDITLLPGFSGSRIQSWRERVHASIVSKIHQLWPKPQAELMDAMVLGEESFIRNATRAEYQRSGTYHVLVVSGINLSILAASIFWLLRRFRLDPAIAAIATVVVSFAYAFVVGVGPPVWRAALMLATYLVARMMYRERNMMNAIGAAAVVVLIADPH